jgi:hypothetical protein
MASTTSNQQSGPPPDLLAATEEMCREAAQELFAALQEVRRGRLGEVKTAAQAIRDLRAAFQLAMEERNRVERLRKEDAGIVHGYALDFDAARAEIIGRLARIRDAGGN